MTKQTWQTYRKQGIGGSDCATVCRINKYKSAFQLWSEKRGNYHREESESESAYWGTVLEPLLVDEFVRRTNLTVTTVPAILQHPEYPFMLANLDGIVNADDGDFILEIKMASSYLSDEWGNGENYVPYHYRLQVQHYMAVTDLPGAYIAVLIGGNDFRYYFIERDDELINMLITLEKQFWHYVENNTPPPIDGSDAAKDYINSLFPQAMAKKSIVLNDSCLKYIEDFESYQEQENQYRELKEKSANELKLLIGDNEIARIADRIVSWKNVEQERLDSKRLASENPDLYNQYLNKTSFRRFTIKQMKEVNSQ